VIIVSLGGGEEDAKEITRHPFFACINWQDLVEKKVSLSLNINFFLFFNVYYNFFESISLNQNNFFPSECSSI